MVLIRHHMDDEDRLALGEMAPHRSGDCTGRRGAVSGIDEYLRLGRIGGHHTLHFARHLDPRNGIHDRRARDLLDLSLAKDLGEQSQCPLEIFANKGSEKGEIEM